MPGPTPHDETTDLGQAARAGSGAPLDRAVAPGPRPSGKLPLGAFGLDPTPPPRVPGISLSAPPGVGVARAPARFTDTGPVRPGGRLGPYVVSAELARGGMGVVYRARHSGLEREVALKVLPMGAMASETELQRFRVEARAAARLRHPNVVTVHDVGEFEGVLYLAMDLVDGESLAAQVERGPLEPRAAAALCRKVALALHHAHAQGVLHRDVKPANVLVTRAGEPMLVDFGLAKVEAKDGAAGPTRTGQLLGTPAFMAPEQAQGVYVDARTDVYGLGATLYSALTGSPPFGTSTTDLFQVLRLVVLAEPESPSKLAPGLDRDLETICVKCLEKEPSRRYASALDLALDLERWLAGEAIEARPPSRAERLARWVRRNRALAAGAAYTVGLALIGGTAATVWAVRRSAAEELRAADTRRQALDEARQAVVTEARLAAARARAELDAAGAGPRERPVVAALRALQAAQRWQDLEPGPASARARFDAALALGEVAVAREHFDLALEAFGQADGLGVDDARARAAYAAAVEARDAGARRRREEVSRWLDATASGELGRRADGLAEAVLRIVRWPEADTVAALVARLEGVTASLRRAEAEALREAERRGAPIAGLDEALEAPLGRDEPARDALARAVRRATAVAGAPGRRAAWLHLLAERQTAALRPGEADLARVACEALGWIGVREGAEAALAAYLDAEADEARAAFAAVALARLGGDLLPVHGARARFGHYGPLDQRLAVCAPELGGPGGDPPLDLLDQAHVMLQAGDREGAREALQAAVADPVVGANPTRHLDAHVLLAELLRRAGDLPAARAAFDRALALEPCDAGALLGRCAVLSAQGEQAAALADAARAVDVAPELPLAWAERGRLQPDPARGRADCEKALSLDTGLLEGWLGLGAARLALGDAAGAVGAWNEALARDPNNAEAWAGLPGALTRRGDLKAALDAADRAVALMPRDTAPLALRARLRDAQGDRPGAEEDLTRALALTPASPELRLARARVREARDDKPGAIADLEALLKLEPLPAEAPLARSMLDLLRRECAPGAASASGPDCD